MKQPKYCGALHLKCFMYTNSTNIMQRCCYTYFMHIKALGSALVASVSNAHLHFNPLFALLIIHYQLNSYFCGLNMAKSYTHILLSFLLYAFLTSCSTFTKVQKSNNYEYKLRMAENYFVKGNYTNAQVLF